MEVPDGGLGDLGALPPIDVGDNPQPVGTTSVRILPVAVRGAGRITGSRPRDAVEGVGVKRTVELRALEKRRIAMGR